LCLLATYAWGKRTAGPRAAFMGAIMLCLSPRWAQLAPMVSMNALLALWVTIALAAAHRALTRPSLSRRWWCLSALACGLGFLTKGPVALALVAVPVLLYQWLNRRSARADWSMWALYGVLVAAVALPWFVMLAIQDSSFLYYFVWIHHVRRVFDPIDHQQPFWYYLPLLFLGMLPWSLLLPAIVKQMLSRVRPGTPQPMGNLSFFLLAGGWSLLFFSAAGCKRPCYILPIMPPLALALGCTVDAWCCRCRLWFRLWGGVAAASFGCLAAAALFVLPWYADKYSVRGRVLPYRAASADGAPVLCYPHVWDGVSFYLERNDVHFYGPEQLEDMMTALQAEPRSLVVVKDDLSLPRFLDALPESLEFVPHSRQYPVVVGWVRRRPPRPDVE
jgi:4-amino-4-deoxy-L-arabinose transferase-like glycosyltransferase